MTGVALPQAGDDFLHGRQCEIFVVVEGEFAAPGVEELDGGGACGDLGFQVRNGGLRDAMEEVSKSGRLAEQETFYCGEAFFGAAFDHVAGQRPGSGGKAQNGNVGAADFADNAANGFREEARVDFRVEEFQLFDVALRCEQAPAGWGRRRRVRA